MLERAGKLIAIEAKSGKTISSDALDNLIKWKKIIGAEASSSYLVYAGKDAFMQRGVQVLSWDNMMAGIS